MDIDIVYFTPSLFVQWLGIGGKLSVVPMMTGLHCPIFGISLISTLNLTFLSTLVVVRQIINRFVVSHPHFCLFIVPIDSISTLSFVIRPTKETIHEYSIKEH